MYGLAARLTAVYRTVLVLPLLFICARYHRSRCHLDLAKRRLLCVTNFAPTCFKAHFLLGSIYLEERDFTRAKKSFLLARGLNPGKFRRLYPSITGETGDVNINLFYFPGFTDRGEDGDAPADFLREFIGEPVGDSREPEHVAIGDFSSFSEYRKFKELGPFREDETMSVDWDEVEKHFREDEGRQE